MINARAHGLDGRGIKVNTKEGHEPSDGLHEILGMRCLDEDLPAGLRIVQFALEPPIDSDESLDDADRQLRK